MTAMRRLLVAVVVLLALLVVGDRVARAAADRVVAQRIEQDQALSQRPQVSIDGFPFLTQAIAGRYDHVTLTMHDLRAGPLPVQSLRVVLRGVHVPLSAVLSQHLTRVPVDRAAATVLVRYADLGARVGGNRLTVSKGTDGEVKVSGTVTAFGHSVSASGEGKLEVRGDEVVVTVGHGLDFTIPLGGLPFRIALVGAKATKSGIEVDATASGLVLPVQR
jgi:hypothetical protein